MYGDWDDLDLHMLAGVGLLQENLFLCDRFANGWVHCQEFWSKGYIRADFQSAWLFHYSVCVHKLPLTVCNIFI